LLKNRSGHSRLATGVEKLPFNYKFRYFILADSKEVLIDSNVGHAPGIYRPKPTDNSHKIYAYRLATIFPGQADASPASQNLVSNGMPA
jgi:hypothetical protein